MKRQKRFEMVASEGLRNSGGAQTWVVQDKTTGVQYLVVNTPGGTGVTPLLGSDGRPIVHGVWNAPGAARPGGETGA